MPHSGPEPHCLRLSAPSGGRYHIASPAKGARRREEKIRQPQAAHHA